MPDPSHIRGASAQPSKLRHKPVGLVMASVSLHRAMASACTPPPRFESRACDTSELVVRRGSSNLPSRFQLSRGLAGVHLGGKLNAPALHFRHSRGRCVISTTCSLAGSSTSVGSFRAGQKRAEVQVPSLALFLDTIQCSQSDKDGESQGLLSLVDAAVAGGATLVVLEAAEVDLGSASKLFEAACTLKTLLRGRAPLLVWERADIAAAAGADGVLLSDQGLPAVAARRMMEGISQGSSVLPLVGRQVGTVPAAIKASAGDGADLIILSVPEGTQLGKSSLPSEEASSSGETQAEGKPGGLEGGEQWVREAVSTIRGAQVTVPLVLDLRQPRGEQESQQGWGDALTSQTLRTTFQTSLASGASGIALHLADVAGVLASADGPGPRATVTEIVGGGSGEMAADARDGNVVLIAQEGAEEFRTLTQEPRKPREMQEPLETERSGGPTVQNGSTSAAAAAAAAGQEAEQVGEPTSQAEERQQVAGRASSMREQRQVQEAPPFPVEQVPPGGARNGAVSAPPFRSPVVRPPRIPGLDPGVTPMEMEGRDVLKQERDLLLNFIDFLHIASPQMAEADLLRDAVARLADPFLVVIVGEFNSGKSSLINALLGEKFLKVGAVPTTNEITLIRHADDVDDEGEGGERAEGGGGAGGVVEQRHADGHILRYLPSSLLKQLNIVDTPGTNVILERQQRLTEEFVPQADIVLFVLSADRPLTDSEVSFLRYIRQWGKKVVFVLNKIDLLDENEGEVSAVYNFVCDNVKRLLGADTVSCFPVSSRLALASKTQGAGSVVQVASAWEASRFNALESYIFSFLEGSTDAGAERLRLKLDTPLGVGAALLSACERQLGTERSKADADMAAIQAVGSQMLQYGDAMRADSELQQSRIFTLVESARERAEEIVDQVLRTDNVEVLAQYLLAPSVSPDSQLPVLKSFQTKVVGSAFYDVRRALLEHFEWLQSNNARQLKSYTDFASSRWPALAQILEHHRATQPPPAESLEGGGSLQQEAGPGTEEAGEREAGAAELQTVAALEGFDTSAAALLLEEELRVAVTSIATGFGGAAVSASVLTSMFNNPLEDLLALALCTAGGSLGILNLPGKREDVKRKIRRAASGLVNQLRQKLNEELETSLERLKGDVDGTLLPYRVAVEEEVARVSALQGQLEEYGGKINGLRQRVRNIGS